MWRGWSDGWVHDDSSVELWAICGSSVHACILLESRESESGRANHLKIDFKFVAVEGAQTIILRNKLNSLKIAAQGIGPCLVGSSVASFFIGRGVHSR
jgi:hypothetical protein